MNRRQLKILILGGYGTFGGRLAELLCNEKDLILVIAGRSISSATDLCERLPAGAICQAQAMDRDIDLERRLSEIAPDIVVDASGPFQAYGDDPYRVVKAAIAVGAHYLDFADGSDFVRGISQFDAAARDAGLTILSGVSSFPVLTAAVVRHLSSDLQTVDTITGGIAPSPYAGVGLNVIRAIAGYSGQKVQVRRNGIPDTAYALTETHRYTIAPPGFIPLRPIDFSLVDVPDLQLLTDLWPEVQSVWMGAGPLPAVLHRMLRWLAYAVRWRLFPSLSPVAKLMFHTIRILRWGEHRGGMFVEIEGTEADGNSVRRSWHLLAEGDDGPLIPSMAIEALVRNWLAGQEPQIGARPATAELDLADYATLFRDRRIYTADRRQDEIADGCLYGRLLGSAWQSLPTAVKSLHSASPRLTASGKAKVTRGTGILARLAAKIVGFPEAANDVNLSVSIQQTEKSEIWTRNFAGQIFSSVQFEGTGRFERLLCERFGPMTVGIALVVDSDRMKLVVRRWSIFGVPMPHWLAPSGESYEFEEQGTFHFHVEIRAPIVGLIVQYAGHLHQSNGMNTAARTDIASC